MNVEKNEEDKRRVVQEGPCIVWNNERVKLEKEDE